MRMDGQPVVDRLNEAIRDNPLAAGLIGAGVAWMLLGSRGLGVAAGAARTTAAAAATAAGRAAAGAGSAAASAGARAASAFGEAASMAKDAAGAVRDAAAEAVTKTMESAPSLAPEMPDTSNSSVSIADMGTSVGERLRQAASSGREYGAAIQSRLSENLERQPLLLGAIGLAIGAGIAASFATTAAEKQWIGRSADAAREKIGDAAARHARQVFSGVREEAERQGLTPDAIKKTAASMAGKARNVAEAARDSANESFASRS